MSILIICLASAIFPTAVINFCVPEGMFYIGPIVGALCCAFTIKFLLGLSFPKSAFAAGVFFFSQIGLALAFAF